MRITAETIEITPDEMINWDDVKTLRLLNDKLAFVLKSGQIVGVGPSYPWTIDEAFRHYENT